MPTLLEKAREYQTRKGRKYMMDDELIDLALAYFKGEISIAQAARAIETSNQCAHQRLMTQFSWACRAGRIQIRDARHE